MGINAQAVLAHDNVPIYFSLLFGKQLLHGRRCVLCVTKRKTEIAGFLEVFFFALA